LQLINYINLHMNNLNHDNICISPYTVCNHDINIMLQNIYQVYIIIKRYLRDKMWQKKNIFIYSVQFFSPKIWQNFSCNETIPSYQHLYSWHNSYNNYGPIILNFFSNQYITKIIDMCCLIIKMQSIKIKYINNSKVYITCKINWFQEKQ